MPLPVIVLAFAFFFLLSYRNEKRAERERAAMYYWCNTGEIFRELLDNPFMTTAKWQSLLPLFDDADRRYEGTHPCEKNFTRYGDLVRQEIEMDYEEKIGSP